ncbi:SIMPL domain-containing protein [Lentzea roselyniae]|uniref:SIMPL domain-containing protein n=1 Tax=Lentzea roselyniae TaxID=531940 RepID=A0ABP7BFE8_9PSEU
MLNSQMVERPWGMTVFGAADVKARPDLVRVRFKVSRVEQTPSESFAAASEAIGAVRQVLRGHGVPDAAVERSHLDLQSSHTYGTPREFLGYQCEATFAVETRDLDDVQPLLVDLVAAGANEIAGVEFDVSGKAELRAEARRQAVAAARRKAELYAEAALVRLGSVVHIEDVDPEKAGGGRYRGHGGGGDASADDLAPGHVVVMAAVILGFSINHG